MNEFLKSTYAYNALKLAHIIEYFEVNRTQDYLLWPNFVFWPNFTPDCQFSYRDKPAIAATL